MEQSTQNMEDINKTKVVFNFNQNITFMNTPYQRKSKRCTSKSKQLYNAKNIHIQVIIQCK